MKLSKEFVAMFREEARRAQWEINRWNGKSIDDLVIDYLERKELKPEYFTGAVILTVEEAKEAIGDYIGVVAEVVRQRNKPEIKIKHPKSILVLTERILKAESKE